MASKRGARATKAARGSATSRPAKTAETAQAANAKKAPHTATTAKPPNPGKTGKTAKTAKTARTAKTAKTAKTAETAISTAPPPTGAPARPTTRPATGPSLPGFVGNRALVQRTHARVDVRLRARVLCADGEIEAVTRDLSEGGAGIECDRALAEDAEVMIGLSVELDGPGDATRTTTATTATDPPAAVTATTDPLPPVSPTTDPLPPVSLRGRVAWCVQGEDPGRHIAGLRFTAPTGEQRRWLEQAIAWTKGRRRG